MINSKEIAKWALLVGTGAVGILAVAEKAQAAHKRVHASVCRTAFREEGDAFFMGEYAMTTQDEMLYCPVPSDSNLPHSSVNTLNVHGLATSGNRITARACTQPYNQGSGQFRCGSIKNGDQNGALGVDASAMRSNGTGFPYLMVTVGPNGRLYGFYLSS